MPNLIISLDNGVEQYLNSVSQPALSSFFHLITELGSALFISILVFSVISFLWKRGRALIIYFIPAVILTEIVVFTMKHIVGRLRPFGALKYNEFDGSMPSGHATIAILMYGYICYLITRFYPKSLARDTSIALLSGLILLIGFSRLYLDVHYFSDVFAGYLLGGTALFYLVKFSEQGRRK